MTPSQADWKPSLQQGELRGHYKDQGQDWHVSRGRSDSQGEARVQSAASLLHSHQEARLVIAEQGVLSVDEAVSVTGSQVRRGPRGGAGLAESKGR